MRHDLDTLLKAHRSSPILGVYDGRERLGSVVEHEGEHLAFDAVGQLLGRFPKRSEAIRIIPRSSATSSTATGGRHG